MYKKLYRPKYLLTAIISTALICSCHEHHEHEEGHHHELEERKDHGSEDEVHTNGIIVLSPEAALSSGVETAIVQSIPFKSVIRCSGRILPCSEGEITLVAPASGILHWEQGTPAIGSRLSQKQILAIIKSENLAQTDAAQAAKLDYEVAAREYSRAQMLINDKTISAGEFERIEANYKKAKNLLDNISTANPNGSGINIVSPTSAQISAIIAGEGSFVQLGEPVAVLRNSRRLRLQVDLPQKYAASFADFSGANFSLPYLKQSLSIAQLGGKLISVSNSIESGYIPIIFEFANPGDILIGSFAQVWLLGRERNDVIALPQTALIEEQGQFFVYIKLDDDCYRKQSVIAGSRDGHLVEILQGIHIGEEVVVKGAYQVKLASASVIPGHSHNH